MGPKRRSSKLPAINKPVRALTGREARKAKAAEEKAANSAALLKKEAEKELLELGKMKLEEKIMRDLIATERRLAAELAGKKRLEEEAAIAAAKARLVEEKRIRGIGMVKLIYEQYDEEFTIDGGSTTQDNIDDVYCLSFVMPDCVVRLSKLNPQEMRTKLNDDEAIEKGVQQDDFYMPEDPRGTFKDLEKDNIYYVYVVQQVDQLLHDQEMQKRVAATMEGAGLPHKSGGARAGGARGDTSEIERLDDGRFGLDSCSCIYGNPCMDEYGCKDWLNRFAISTANGWKGF
jgi:hypothetical protein